MKKLTLFFSVLFIVLISCQDKQTKGELDKLQEQIKIEEQNKALIQKILIEGDKHNIAILEEVCSPDY